MTLFYPPSKELHKYIKSWLINSLKYKDSADSKNFLMLSLKNLEN